MRIAYDTLGRRLSDLCDGQGVEHAHVSARSLTTRILARFEYSIRFEDGETALTDCTWKKLDAPTLLTGQ